MQDKKSFPGAVDGLEPTEGSDVVHQKAHGKDSVLHRVAAWWKEKARRQREQRALFEISEEDKIRLKYENSKYHLKIAKYTLSVSTILFFSVSIYQSLGKEVNENVFLGVVITAGLNAIAALGLELRRSSIGTAYHQVLERSEEEKRAEIRIAERVAAVEGLQATAPWHYNRREGLCWASVPLNEVQHVKLLLEYLGISTEGPSSAIHIVPPDPFGNAIEDRVEIQVRAPWAVATMREAFTEARAWKATASKTRGNHWVC